MTEIESTTKFIQESPVGTPANVKQKAIEVLPLLQKFGERWINTERAKHCVAFYIEGDGNGKRVDSAVYMDRNNELKFYLHYEQIDMETDDFIFDKTVSDPTEENFDDCIRWLTI